MKNLLLFFIATVLCSCSSTKTNPTSYSKDKILFGNGGGFSGIEKTYTLLDNGAVFEMTKMNTEYNKIKTIQSNQAIQIFKNYKFLNFESLELNSPGNTYKFMEFSVNGKTNRIVWSDKNDSKDANTMHAILMNTIK